jgi:hypothetical protein
MIFLLLQIILKLNKYNFVHQEDNGEKNINKWDWKGFVMYNKYHGMTTMSNYVISKYYNLLSIYKSQKNVINLITNVHQPFKKIQNLTTNSFTNFFCNRFPYKKSNPLQE